MATQAGASSFQTYLSNDRHMPLREKFDVLIAPILLPFAVAVAHVPILIFRM